MVLFGMLLTVAVKCEKVAKLIVEEEECHVETDGIVENKTIT